MLFRSGEPRGAEQIFSSNGQGLAAFLRQAGAEPLDLGIAPDDREALHRLIGGAGLDGSTGTVATSLRSVIGWASLIGETGMGGKRPRPSSITGSGPWA